MAGGETQEALLEGVLHSEDTVTSSSFLVSPLPETRRAGHTGECGPSRRDLGKGQAKCVVAHPQRSRRVRSGKASNQQDAHKRHTFFQTPAREKTGLGGQLQGRAVGTRRRGKRKTGPGSEEQ
jgi:hypothetical protein